LQHPLPPLLLSLLLSLLSVGAAGAEDIRYVSDKQYIPLRSGAGNDFTVVHRGLPSGTRLRVARLSTDGEWAEITTDRGTGGWIRTQYLMEEQPAQSLLEEATRRAQQLAGENTRLAAELAALKGERPQMPDSATGSGSLPGGKAEALAHLEQISGKAEELDVDNHRLVVAAQTLRSELEMLEAENQRLQDRLKSEDFINGALAVLLGVIITLVVPRLWPRRRGRSSWA
jgi:SH3 domain protein